MIVLCHVESSGCMPPSGDERNILKVWVGGKLRSSRCGTPSMKLGRVLRS